jgi:hypothetical protein
MPVLLAISVDQEIDLLEGRFGSDSVLTPEELVELFLHVLPVPLLALLGVLVHNDRLVELLLEAEVVLAPVGLALLVLDDALNQR